MNKISVLREIPYTIKENKQHILKETSRTQGCGDWWKTSLRNKAKINRSKVKYTRKQLRELFGGKNE